MGKAHTPAAFAGPGRQQIRDLVSTVARHLESRAILDLWGGGASARKLTQSCPTAVVTSAERDPVLWASMRLDAQQHGYAPVMGDIVDAEGVYDLIWFDGSSPPSRELGLTLKMLGQKLIQDRGPTREQMARWAEGGPLPPPTEEGWLIATVMPAREVGLLDDRLWATPKWIERTTGLRVRFIVPYERNHGQLMWLIGLVRAGRNARSRWDDQPYQGREWLMRLDHGEDWSPYDDVVEEWTRNGFLSCWDHGFALDELEAGGPDDDDITLAMHACIPKSVAK